MSGCKAKVQCMIDKQFLLAFSSATAVLCAQGRQYLNAHMPEVLGHMPQQESLVLCAQDRYYLTDAYMREVLEHMSSAQLIDTILIRFHARRTGTT